MVQKKYLIITFYLLFIFSNCTSTNTNLSQYSEYPHTNQINNTTSFFYVSKQQTDGDIWLYDLDKNSFWEITFLDDINIKILSVSYDKKYVVFENGDNEVYIVDAFSNRISSIKDIYGEELNSIYNIDWISNNMFLCLTHSDSYTTQKLLRVYKKDNEWIYQQVDDMFYTSLFKVVKFKTSHNKRYVSILSSESDDGVALYIYDNESQHTKRMNFINQTNVDVIWSEDNNSLFYNQGKAVYEMKLNGFNKIICMEDYDILRLYQNPKYKFKLYYTVKSDDTFSIYEKNIDIPGRGELIKSVNNLRYMKILFDGYSAIYDNDLNEIYYLNLNTTENQLLFSDSALFALQE